jgi:DNA-directed RNA polymerase subunit RPC12/RpoP
MTCPKCGAQNMQREKPIYFNRDNREGKFIFLEEVYHCRICGKELFVNKNLKMRKLKYIKGQSITGGYENL